MYRDDPKQRIEDLEYQLRREREDREAERTRQYREREEAREERKREIREWMQYANDWPDGFRKGLPRLRYEADDEVKTNNESANTPGAEIFNYFTDLVPKVEKALEIYNAEMQQAEIEIARIRQAALDKIANRVEAETGADELAKAFRENNPNWLTEW